MKTSLKLTLGAIALGLAASSFAQSDTGAPMLMTTKADPKVTIQIPQKAIDSKKVIVEDGKVYVRIGKERTMDSGSIKYVEFQYSCGGYGVPCFIYIGMMPKALNTHAYLFYSPWGEYK